MSATKQYLHTGPSPTTTTGSPTAASYTPHQTVLPIIFHGPAAPGTSPQPIPVLYQRAAAPSDAGGVYPHVGYPNSVPSQQYVTNPPLVENQVCDFPSSVRSNASHVGGGEGGTSYPHPGLAHFGRDGQDGPPQSTTTTATYAQPQFTFTQHPGPALPGSSGVSTIASTTGDPINYSMMHYVQIPSPSSSPQGSVPFGSALNHARTYDAPPPPGSQHSGPAPRIDRRHSQGSFAGYEYRPGYHGTERRHARAPKYGGSYDPFEDDDTDQAPMHALRARRASQAAGAHAMEAARSLPSNGARRRSEHHVHAPTMTLDREDGPSDDDREQSSVLSAIFGRKGRSKSRARNANNQLMVPGSSVVRHRSRHHRSSMTLEAPRPDFGPRGRAASMSYAAHPRHDLEGLEHFDDPNRRRSAPQPGRSKSLHRRSKSVSSRYRRSSSTSSAGSDTDSSTDRVYDTADERRRRGSSSHHRGPGAGARSKSRRRRGSSEKDKDNDHSRRNALLGGLGGAALGNMLLPGAGTLLAPALTGGVVGTVAGHEYAKDGGLEGARRRGVERGRRKWDRYKDEWEAGRRAGEEEGRRRGAAIAKKEAREREELRARVQRRERGIGAGGGGA